MGFLRPTNYSQNASLDGRVRSDVTCSSFSLPESHFAQFETDIEDTYKKRLNQLTRLSIPH